MCRAGGGRRRVVVVCAGLCCGSVEPQLTDAHAFISGSHPPPPASPSLILPADGPGSLAPLQGSVPSNLGGMGDHHSLHHGLPSSGSMGSLQAMQAGLHLSSMHHHHGLMGSSGDLHMMPHSAQQAAMMMAAAHAAHSGGSSPGGPQPMGRGGAIKLGRGVADPSAYQHKLFIGQIPFEVGARAGWDWQGGGGGGWRLGGPAILA